MLSILAHQKTLNATFKNVAGLAEMDSQVHAFCCTMACLVHTAMMILRTIYLTVLAAGANTYTVISLGNLPPVSGHQCCDICAKTCECGQDICKEPTTLVFEVREDSLPSGSVRTVEEKEKLQLRMELFQYMKNLLIHNTSGPVASVNMLHEFTPLHIKQVLDNCDKIKTVQDVEKFIEVWRKEHSRAILGAIHQVFGDVACGELEALEKEVDGMEEFAQEWADIRDDSELCQLLSESDYLDVDVQMEEIDQSGNEEVNVSSMIAGLFK